MGAITGFTALALYVVLLAVPGQVGGVLSTVGLGLIVFPLGVLTGKAAGLALASWRRNRLLTKLRRQTERRP
jgi:hypothetical protein